MDRLFSADAGLVESHGHGRRERHVFGTGIGTLIVLIGKYLFQELSKKFRAYQLGFLFRNDGDCTHGSSWLERI